MQGKVVDIKSENEFDEIIKEKSKLTIVDFSANWCGPCKTMAPIYEQLAKENKDINFLKVDVDECEQIAVRYKIESMPTFIVLKNGNVINKLNGANKTEFIEMVKKLIESNDNDEDDDEDEDD